MSYDIDIINSKTGKIVETHDLHFVRGGTFNAGGTRRLSLNITYNYSKHFYRVLGPEGIRTIYGKSVAETLPLLAEAVGKLKNNVHEDYWEPTQGNARNALLNLITLGAQALTVMGVNSPDAIWQGD